MPEKKPKSEEENIDWHQFEYSEIGSENDDSERESEQNVKNRSLKNLEMYLRKSWCCGK